MNKELGWKIGAWGRNGIKPPDLGQFNSDLLGGNSIDNILTSLWTGALWVRQGILEGEKEMVFQETWVGLPD